MRVVISVLEFLIWNEIMIFFFRKAVFRKDFSVSEIVVKYSYFFLLN